VFMEKKILIVDDQPGIVLLLKEILETEGYRIVTAATGQEALESIRNHMPDLIILDYRIPIINGIEVVQKLEEENISVPIILMSGLPEKLNQKTKDHRQIVGMLAKPFDIQGVGELVRESIESYS